MLRVACNWPTVLVAWLKKWSRYFVMALELKFTRDARRLAARSAYRERVRAMMHEGVVVFAGRWVDESGALLVFDATRDQVDAIIIGDPYYATPGVTIKSLKQVKPVIER